MSRRIRKQEASRQGRPTVLSPRVADAVVDAVAGGNHITTACAAAGISRAALYVWLKKADAIEQALEAGKPCDPGARALMDFRDRLALARAHAHLRAMKVVQQAMRGGLVISEEPIRDKKGNVLRRDDGEILCARRYSQPDGWLALQYLARSAPDQWGPHATPTIDLTGQLDPTTEDESSADQISRLSGRLALVVAQRRAEDEEAEGDHTGGIDRAATI